MIIRKAVMDDWENLLNWRNDPLTRANTASNQVIEKEQHINWLKNKGLESEKINLYIAEIEGVPVGTIRSEYLNQDVPKVSWTIGPEFRNKGFGKQMIETFSKTILSYFKVEIKQQDIYSQKIVADLNFEILDEDEDKKYYQIRA